MSTSTTYAVQGMTCTSCAGKVTAAVNAVDGVEDAEVDLASGTLTVDGDNYDDSAALAAITEAGYQLG